MSTPTKDDFSLSTNMKAEDLYKVYQKDGKTDWSVGDLETVQSVMDQTGYPADNIHFVKGKVEDTIPQIFTR